MGVVVVVCFFVLFCFLFFVVVFFVCFFLFCFFFVCFFFCGFVGFFKVPAEISKGHGREGINSKRSNSCCCLCGKRRLDETDLGAFGVIVEIMPARHSKQATKRATTKQKTTRKAKDACRARVFCIKCSYSCQAMIRLKLKVLKLCVYMMYVYTILNHDRLSYFTSSIFDVYTAAGCCIRSLCEKSLSVHVSYIVSTGKVDELKSCASSVQFLVCLFLT